MEGGEDPQSRRAGPAADGRTTPLLARARCPRRCRSSSYYASSFRLKTTVWSELGGSVGDLGTYVPIVLALSLVNHLDLGTTLIFTAAYNVLTGLLFGVPMPVQPMKSIAAVAISESAAHLTVPQIMAAGICTASVLLALGAMGLMSVFYGFIPLPVVRGVQLSQGLQFAFSAIKYIRYDQDFSTGKSGGARPWLGLDGLVLALSAVLFIILVTGSGDDGGDGGNRLYPLVAAEDMRVRGKERCVRDVPRHWEAGAGFGVRQLVREDTGAVPHRPPRRAAPLLRHRVGHGLQGHGEQGVFLRDAGLRCRLAYWIQCRPGLWLWHPTVCIAKAQADVLLQSLGRELASTNLNSGHEAEANHITHLVVLDC